MLKYSWKYFKFLQITVVCCLIHVHFGKLKQKPTNNKIFLVFLSWEYVLGKGVLCTKPYIFETLILDASMAT